MADTTLTVMGADGLVKIKLVDNGDGTYSLPVNVVFAGDVEIGAVELKDAATDVRASVVAANTARSAATVVVATQPIDAAGAVLGRTAANTVRTTGTLVDPVQIIGADGAVLSASPVLGAGTASIGGTTDNGPHWTSIWGVSAAPVESADMSAAAVAVTDAPTAGQKIVPVDYILSNRSAVALVFTLTEETSGTLVDRIPVPAGQVVQLTWRSKKKLATADKKLMCQTSAAGAVTVNIAYYSEA